MEERWPRISRARARVVLPRRQYGITRSALLASLQAKEPAHHRVAAFRHDRILIPNEAHKIVPVTLGLAALKDCLHVVKTIKRSPSLQVDIFPLSVRQMGMVGDLMVRIIEVEVRIHPFLVAESSKVVLRARQRGQHEEGSMVGFHILHQEGHVAPHRFGRIARKPNDVPDVR